MSGGERKEPQEKREAWSAREDRPHLRPLREESSVWPAWVAAIAVITGAFIYGWIHFYGMPSFGGPAREKSAAPPPEAKAPAKPAVQYPIQGPSPEAAANLPTLENSDALLRRGLAELLGRQAFERFVTPDRLVRRIVSTIDNLPRSAAPRSRMPLIAVPGGFIVERSGDATVLSRRNFARYGAFVAVAEAINADALARFYTENYPLFQRAYDELGFGGRNFNDRLVETIDDLLAAPEPKTPIRLEQRKVQYEFADPELESLSAGQKIMLRMGPENAARLKKKLREIRQPLVAARP